MSVASTTQKIIYAGNGSTTVFPIPFGFYSSTEVEVWLRDESVSPPTEAKLVNPTHYSVTGMATSGLSSAASVTMVTAPASTAKLLVRRVVALTQGQVYSDTSPFPAKLTERALDELCMATQALLEEASRAVRLSPTEPSSFDPHLPTNLSGQVSMTLVTNASGTAFAIGPSVATVTEATTAAAAAAASAAAAATSATNAATSATAAATSATSSASSATAAATSATNAATSAASAAASAASASTAVLTAVLTGFASTTGTVTATDTVLSAIEKNVGNIAANTASIATNTSNISSNTSAIAAINASKGAASGIATLDSGGKVPTSQLPSTVMEFQGSWNPNTNTPALSDASGTAGNVYWVSAAKSGAVSGLANATMANFQIGDLVIYSAASSQWELSSPAAGVQSVNGAQGVVTVNAINQLTGDVTAGPASGSASAAATIAANAVTNAKAAQMAASTIKGNNSGSTANASDLTATQVTAMLNAFVGDSGAGGTKGLVPAPAAGDGAATKVLRADGTWGAAGTASPLTTKGDIYTYSSTNARHVVPGDYGDMIPDSGATDGWRNATYLTKMGGKPGKNYVQYADFENNATTGWSLGITGTLTNGLPTGTPTFGSGADANLSFSVISSGQLAGSYSGSYGTSVGHGLVAGNMVATASLPIDIADQAKVLGIKFSYQVQTDPSSAFNYSGTSSSSLAVALWDVTNSVWLPVVGAFNFVQKTGVGIFQGTVQTGATTANVRLCVYNANAVATQIIVALDDFYLGPQAMAFGPAMSDWQSYTPTFGAGFGTVTSIDFWYRRIGDSLYVSGRATTGTVAASATTITLPNGWTIDGTKVANNRVAGKTTRNANVAYNEWYLIAASGSPSTVSVGGAVEAGTANATTPLTAANGSTVYNSSETFTVDFVVPITGWSSNTAMSADTDTRVIAASYTGATSNVPNGTATVAVYPTLVKDTAAAYNNSTGVFTVPVTGQYLVIATGGAATPATNQLFTMNVRKNSTVKATGFSQAYTASESATVSVPALLDCVAGDTIDVTVNTNNTAMSMVAAHSTLQILRLPGPAVVAASEKVYLQYTGNAGTALTANTTNIDWSTKVVDSHAAWSGTVFTAPRSGWYNLMGSVNLTAGSNNSYYAYVNGSQKQIIFGGPVSYATKGIAWSGYLNGGDQLSIRSDTGSITLSNSATVHWLSIASQG